MFEYYNEAEVKAYHNKNKKDYKTGYYLIKGIGEIVFFDQVNPKKGLYVKKSIRVNEIIDKYIAIKLYLSADEYYNNIVADKYLYEMLIYHHVYERAFTETLRNICELKLNYIKKIRNIA